MYAIEKIRDFKIYSPRPGASASGWSMAWNGDWLPVILADRDACMIVMGMVIAGTPDAVLEGLRDQYNRAEPSVLVTVDHLAAHGSTYEQEN